MEKPDSCFALVSSFYPEALIASLQSCLTTGFFDTCGSIGNERAYFTKVLQRNPGVRVGMAKLL